MNLVQLRKSLRDSRKFSWDYIRDHCVCLLVNLINLALHFVQTCYISRLSTNPQKREQIFPLFLTHWSFDTFLIHRSFNIFRTHCHSVSFSFIGHLISSAPIGYSIYFAPIGHSISFSSIGHSISFPSHNEETVNISTSIAIGFGYVV